MNYENTIIYLKTTMQFGSRLGLERMFDLMEILGHPAENIPCIHIAGTNGKGSVTSMIANILAASGYRVGVYTSPFLQRFTERIRVIDGIQGLENLYVDETAGEISQKDTAHCISKVKNAIETIIGAGRDHPTEFEIVTAAALVYFQDSSCDFIVLETGLGGRLDSTNIIKNPMRCVITAIGLDHMDRLGSTIEEISAEKAGIIKPNSQVVMLDPMDYTDEINAKKIQSVFQKKAHEMSTRSFVFTGKKDIIPGEYSLDGQTFQLKTYPTEYGQLETISIRTSLLGTFQPMNCALAAAACSGIADQDAIKRGIALSKWPGRMEIISSENPLVVLDGAHNVQGAMALRESLELFLAGRKMVFLCGVMKDKDYNGVLKAVFSSSLYQIEEIYCTTPDNPRALPASELASCASEILDNLPSYGYNDLIDVISYDDVVTATENALSTARTTDAVLVAFGSLYMAGTIRDTIHRNRIIRNRG